MTDSNTTTDGLTPQKVKVIKAFLENGKHEVNFKAIGAAVGVKNAYVHHSSWPSRITDCCTRKRDFQTILAKRDLSWEKTNAGSIKDANDYIARSVKGLTKRPILGGIHKKRKAAEESEAAATKKKAKVEEEEEEEEEEYESA
jgi:hypothetical protein